MNLRAFIQAKGLEGLREQVLVASLRHGQRLGHGRHCPLELPLGNSESELVQLTRSLSSAVRSANSQPMHVSSQ